MVNDERGQTQDDRPRVALLLVLRFAKSEDLDEHATCGKMHAHLVTHLGVVFECAMIDTRRDADANEAPVRPVDGREWAEALVSEAADAMIAIRDWMRGIST